MAIKHVNKKRIELTRQVLLELKHVSFQMCHIVNVSILQGSENCFVTIMSATFNLYRQKTEHYSLNNILVFLVCLVTGYFSTSSWRIE